MVYGDPDREPSSDTPGLEGVLLPDDLAAGRGGGWS